MPIIKPQEYAERRRRLLNAIGPESVALIPSAPEVLRNGDSEYLYRQNSDFYYLTGFNEPEAIAVLLPGNEQAEYLLFNRLRDSALEIWNGKRVGQLGAVQQHDADQAFAISEITEKLPNILAGCKKVYYPIGRQTEFDQLIMKAVKALSRKLRAGYLPPIEFLNIEYIIHAMRLIKSPAEIEVLRKAAAISVGAHQRAIKKCRPGLFEYEIEAELQYEFYRQGSRAPAYNCIVASGENACVLHYTDSAAQLKDGDLLLIDAGCEFEHYAADITRTLPVNGKFTPEQRALYEIVLQAQLAAIALIKPGIPWNQVHELTVHIITEGLLRLGLLQGKLEELIKDKAYNKFYMHNTSHWLGMDVHDAGTYKENDEWRLFEPGMVLTVEPGIYVAAELSNVDKKWWNIGIRIEDDVVVTEQGCEVLSTGLPKTIQELEAIVGKIS